MRFRLIVGAAAVLLCACGSSVAHPTTSATQSNPTASTASTASTALKGAPAAPVCGPKGPRTLAADDKGRVYASSGFVYACSVNPAHNARLGSHKTCLGAGHSGLVAPVALRGTVIAFGLQRCGIDTGRGTVQVQTISGDKVLHSLPALTGAATPESYSRVTAIVLGPGNAVAWIASGSSLVSHSQLLQVNVVDHRGQRALDASRSIAPRSLRLEGTTLHWHDGSTERSAPL